MLSPLSLKPSFGFGDRLGIATPGHIDAVSGTGFAPVFAQQSVRENARTGRTPQQVLDDARRAVESAGWNDPWGADADHLKTMDDIPPFVKAGYTFFTVDPGEYVDDGTSHDSLEVLKKKAKRLNWDELSALYLRPNSKQAWGEFEAESLLRASVKYGRAIRHITEMYRRIVQLKNSADFDFEASVDETNTPTTPLEHFFIANELHHLGTRFTSLAPRFIGRFEKGVDYIGDLAALDADLKQHVAVQLYFGDYKLSLHSGSDKFSVYPLLARATGGLAHVKTAGTSYLEALRVLAVMEPAFFRQILDLSLQRYPIDRATYYVSAELDKIPCIPTDAALPALLDDFYAREVLHVTFGSILMQFGAQLKDALIKHQNAYRLGLKAHFEKHLSLLKVDI